MPRELMALRVHPALLKERMAEKGFSGAELARRCNVGKSTISSLVTAQRHLVQPRVAKAIETELNVKAGEFFSVARTYRVPPRCKGCGTECPTCVSAAA